jgi:peptide deformylase
VKLQIIQIGHPVLNFRSKEIDKIDQTIISLFDNMNETMLLAKGVGLAAPQVAVSKRVMTVLDKKTIRIANPVIIETSGSVTLSEGCLSIPGVNLPITRPKNIQL